ncbi:MAG: histidine kinase [Marinifilaceae bacterium]
MRIVETLRNIIENESLLKKMKIFLNMIFLSVLGILNILRFVDFYNSEDFFYFTSDAFEFLLINICIYFTYFYILKLKNISKQTILIVIIVCTIIILSYFKYVRVIKSWALNDNYYFYISILIDYIGKSTIAAGIIIFINNIEYVLMKNVRKINQELKDTKFQLLRQRFNPHFLFNALNSIYSMAINNNHHTADCILKLSGMMRYLTDDLQQKIVPLKRELDFINEYLAIEEVRFGKDKNVQFNIYGDINKTLIEPLLLFPLVENAFKHANIQDEEGYIIISLEIKDKYFSFKVSNSKNKINNKRIGTGNKLLQKRLSLGYSENAELILKEETTNYTAVLRIKQD